MNTIIGTSCAPELIFDVIGGWTTQFEVGGKKVGGSVPLTKDDRLLWHIETVGGVKGKRILELGPLEGAHTKMMIEAGAEEVVAIEGLSDCFMRCLIVKEVFQLIQAKFLFGDFCEYVAKYSGPKFDIVSASGVLYHQENPAQLIHDLARLTDTVMAWSQVASNLSPVGPDQCVTANNSQYYGKINDYGTLRATSESYCGGLNKTALWLYPHEMRRCFDDAGFKNIIEKEYPPNKNGESLLFVAKK